MPLFMVTYERAINSSINKAPSHSAEIENLQQEVSNAERIACGQGSSEPKQKRRKASAHLIAAKNQKDKSTHKVSSNL